MFTLKGFKIASIIFALLSGLVLCVIAEVMLLSHNPYMGAIGIVIAMFVLVWHIASSDDAIYRY